MDVKDNANDYRDYDTDHYGRLTGVLPHGTLTPKQCDIIRKNYRGVPAAYLQYKLMLKFKKNYYWIELYLLTLNG